jgi:hypothetical protein
MRALIVVVSLLVAPAAAFAQLTGVPYQQWRYTTTMSMAGMPDMPAGMSMPGMRRQIEVCNSEAAAAQGNWDPTCKVTDLGRQGSQQRMRLECAEMSGESTTTWAADGRSFQSKFNAKMRNSPDAMTMNVEGTYLRPCTKAEAKN